MRASGAAHAIVGAEFRLFKMVQGMIEARWTQATDGTKPGGGSMPGSEDYEEIRELLFDVVKRPDFNFTGWSVEVGLRWYFQVP